MIKEVVDKVVDFRPKDVPVGKSLFLLLLGAIPGKLTTKLVKLLVAHFGKYGPEKPTVAGLTPTQWGYILGPAVGFLESMGWRSNFIRRNLGETFSEGLAVGTMMGAIDSAFIKDERWNYDLSDRMSDSVRDLVARILMRPSPGEVTAKPAETSETSTTQLGGFPEAASSAWTGEQEYAGPSTEALGSPEEDPVESIENALEKMSKL